MERTYAMTDNSSQQLDRLKLDIGEKEIHIFPIADGRQYDLDQKHNESQAPSQNRSSDLTVVIPTRNERENVEPLLLALQDALQGINVEVIFVDDSDDDTPLIISNLARVMNTATLHIQLEHRMRGVNRIGGLATAVERGMKLAQANYVAVIDADLQHPPAQLRVFYENAVQQDVDLVLATRYIRGGSYEGLDGVSRRLISIGFKWTAKLLFPERLLGISDPLGGFFLFRRTILNGVTLRPIGYKILLEILIRSQWQSLVEVPYHFHARVNGQSKANMRQGIMALQHMWRLLVEVPSAGRVWKIAGIAAANLLVILTLLTLSTYAPTLWASLKFPLFTIIGLVNFFIMDTIVFPSTHKLMKTNSNAFSISNERQSLEALDTNQPTTPLASALNIQNPQTPLPPSLIEDEPTLRLHTVANPKTPLPPSLNQNFEQPTMPLPTPPTVLKPQTPIPLAVSINQAAQLAPQATSKSAKDKIMSVVPILIIALAIGWVIYTLPGAWIVFSALLIGIAMLTRNNVNKQRAITMILGVAVGLSTIDYLTWRFEVANWVGWWIAIPLLAAETFGAIHTLGFQYTLWPRPRPRVHLTEDPTRHPVFIFIPTVNEGVEILEPTLKGAISARKEYLARYPHGAVNIVVCNDGLVAKTIGWEETEELARRLGVQCITRTVGGGAKAGNIEHARQQLKVTGDALMVIFDADQIAKPEFLLRTIPSFGDQTVGWVQTGQYYRNLDNPVSRWSDDQQSMFYNLLCPGKAAINTAFICGTNVVIRARTLDQIGGFPQDSVTEDFSASIALHPSWRSLFITDVLATGLGPMDMPSYLKQQRRWAIGTLGVLRTHWREIFLPAKNGLSIEQRIQYFLACTHYLCGLRDLIYLLSPILFVLSGIPAVKGSTLEAFIWHFVPYFLASSASLWYAGRGVTGLRGIVIGFGCFPVLLESLLSVILQRKVGFAVTSKQRGSMPSLNYLLVYVIFVIVSLICIAFAISVTGRQQSSMLVSVLWIIYSLCMLGSFLWLSFKDLQFRGIYKASTRENLEASTDYPSRLLNREQGLRPVWNLGLAFLLASLLFTGMKLPIQSAPPAQFAVQPFSIEHPYLGVSLPLSLLKQQPKILQQELHSQFAIVGRTQEVQDLFDRSWTEQLAQQNARPWITLEFGTFNAEGKPPLNASLAAIVNGMNDADLTRWAQSIRDYGRPVYLTTLLHVDRNWSLSSAVANGGIPQDAPKAWLHIQSIFKQAGATNVAWVWSPADPAHDEAYAPPASTIDCVLLSMISYPGTKWADPGTMLQKVATRYPQKPIILEVSADGPATQKAAWLSKVGAAVSTTHEVHALIYHEGSPSIHASNVENNQWSLLSDPSSLAAMQQIAARVTQPLH